MTIKETVQFDRGLLSYAYDDSSDYVKWSAGDDQWHTVSGRAYEGIINLGEGWFFLTQYWDGCQMPVEVPFRLDQALRGN